MIVTPERQVECARSVVEMQHYFAQLLGERAREPRNDLLTELVAASQADTLQFDLREQLTILTIDLLASGNEPRPRPFPLECSC
jgi:cytochrome P450